MEAAKLKNRLILSSAERNERLGQILEIKNEVRGFVKEGRINRLQALLVDRQLEEKQAEIGSAVRVRTEDHQEIIVALRRELTDW